MRLYQPHVPPSASACPVGSSKGPTEVLVQRNAVMEQLQAKVFQLFIVYTMYF